MQGDYRSPNFTLEKTDTRSIGVWGQCRLHYLKNNRKVLYYNPVTSSKLHSNLADIEEQAQELFNHLITDLATNEVITKQLKATG